MKLLKLVNQIKGSKKNETIESAITEFEGDYLKHQENINIHSKNGEGVFYVGKNRDAVHRERNLAGRNSHKISEPSYSRAIFNQKKITIDKHEIDIISYESPLLRAKKGKEGNNFKLDLLGFCKETNSLYVLECKLTIGNNTNPQYGLVESFFYALTIRQHLRNNEEMIKNQIEKCYQANLNENVKVLNNINIIFCVVAPRSYWKRYHRSKNSMKDILNTQNLITSTIKKNNLVIEFGGFLSLGCCSEDILFEKIEGVYYPFIYSEIPKKLVPNLENILN